MGGTVWGDFFGGADLADEAVFDEEGGGLDAGGEDDALGEVGLHRFNQSRLG